MKYLEEKTSNVSILVENQFPSFVRENNSKFIEFISSYYESQENKYNSLDVASNLIDYYNVGYYRKDKLVKYVKLNETSNISKTLTTINVESTKGFPDKNGYIKINDEFIFYKSKNNSQFLDCIRGTSSLVLNKKVISEIKLENSVASEHDKTSLVRNIAYDFTEEFLQKIKSELAPLIPEVLDENLDLSSFIKNIKSFYSSKGSLNSHRILFKILFNDRKINIKFKPRGKDAILNINNSFGKVRLEDVTIINGGVEYDNRTSGGVLINSPVIDIIGNGTGSLNTTTKLIKNKSAVINVTSINSAGTIDGIDVVDEGANYEGAINHRIRPRAFSEDQIVRNVTGTGSGRVEYYDASTDELILYDIVGYFLPNEEIYSDTIEKPRAFISQSYIKPTISRNGADVIGENQNIEFPKEYTFKTSNSKIGETKSAKVRLLDGYSLTNNSLPNVVNFKQDQDKIFGVDGVNIEIDNSTPVINNIFVLDVTTNSDINKLFLPPSTVITLSESNISSSTTNFVVTVDEATRFPITNGIFHVNGKEIFYKNRSSNQFFGCEYLTDIGQSSKRTFNLSIKDTVVSVARLKYSDEWQTGINYNIEQYVYSGDNYYVAKNTGMSGTTAPVHTEGKAYDGTIVNATPVEWEYVGKNRLDHTLYIDYNDSSLVNPRFELLALPGEIYIEDGGSLHTLDKYEFAKYDSPNVDAYSFTTSEISDRLSLLLGTNYNWTRESIVKNVNYSTTKNNNIENNFPSYKSLVAFNSQYDYGDYIYVASTGVPRWWQNIVNLDTTISGSDLKKIAFTNQKLLTRWKKSGLISDTQAIGSGRKTKQSIGLNIDAIQVNSYKGNTISYGYVNRFYISDGGDYKSVYSEDSNGYGYSIDDTKLPILKLTGYTTELDHNYNLILISGSIKSFNFAKLNDAWSSTTNLTGFSSKPKIEIINNNPSIKLEFSNFNGINVTNSRIHKSNHGLTTGIKVLFTTKDNNEYFKKLVSNEEYYVRKFNNNKFTLHVTKSDALMNINAISPSYYTGTSNVSFKIQSDIRNPINFSEAELDISYTNGTIDNIIIKKSGSGYVELPSIRISGGGKVDGVNEWYIDVPYSYNSNRIIDFSGPLVSKYNFDKQNFNELTESTNLISGFGTIQKTFSNPPTVSIDNGNGAEAIAFTSNGKIASIALVNNGSNYLTPPEVVITANDAGTGAVVESIIQNGNVIGFNIKNPGSGYISSPNIQILSTETKSSITCKLREWTFNLVRQLKKLDRIDSYGGYVYDNADDTPSTLNNDNFKLIDYINDFPKDLDTKQYYLIKNTDKLLAKYTLEKAPSDVVQAVETALSKTQDTFTDSEILTYIPLHSPVVCVSYDGIPIYGGNKVLDERNIPITDSTSYVSTKSRYKLKYSTTSSGSNEITHTHNGTTYYISRVGGPSITNYPIGSFIEDYEYNEGDDNDLDEHNGRFSITPEFPEGRYCYFTTSTSYDSVTNSLTDSDFSGFPYFIGDSFASDYDEYMNCQNRTSDKIPSVFTRSFEKDIPDVPVFKFDGIDHNDEYPKEYSNTSKVVMKPFITTGSIDSVLVESEGDNYKVGDRLISDNQLTSGSGFSAIVSKVGGKLITSIQKSSNLLETTFTTGTINHNLTINDFVYFNYEHDGVIDINLHDNHLGQDVTTSNIVDISNVNVTISEENITSGFQNINSYSGKSFYAINLNFKYTYSLKLPAAADFLLTYDIEKRNEFFTLEESPTNTVVLNAEKIPNRLYLHVNNDKIYEINKSKDYYGIQRVEKVTPFSFTIKTPETTNGYETIGLSYTAKSYGASGPLAEVSVSSGGSGYKKLPKISKIIKKGTLDTIAGNGKAIVQTYSTTIGKIKKITYNSSGESFTSNGVVNHYVNIPATAKIINNFEISSIEVLDGGSNYNNAITLLVNGVENLAVLEAKITIGSIASVKVIDGGLNFKEEPTITVKTPVNGIVGSGAILKANIRRKKIIVGQKLTGLANSALFPVNIEATVVSFDQNSSTIEFDENVGQFKDGDTIRLNDKIYGKIKKISRSKAYSRVSSTIDLPPNETNISGTLSDSLQKITDSNYYQDWSYTITSSRDTKDWKSQQQINTHPAGFRQFGKKIIERRKFFFRNPLDVFKSSAIFTTVISSKLDLKLKLASCGKTRIFLPSTSIGVDPGFEVNDFIIGIESGAIGQIIEITANSVLVRLFDDNDFISGEVIVEISSVYASGKSTETLKTFNFWNGIYQEPSISYDVSSAVGSGPVIYIPNYLVDDNDEITLYHFDTEIEKMDVQIVTKDQVSITITKNNIPVSHSNIDKFIISIGGIVQDPNSLTVTGNTFTLSGSLGYDSKLITVKHDNLSKLALSGGTGTTRTITSGQTITSDCQLLLFRTGVSQSQLFTDFSRSGNVITFSESIPAGEVFGWHINETVQCQGIQGSTINQNTIEKLTPCQKTRFVQVFESNSVRKPKSIVEIRKENLSGTMVPVSNTRVEGFNTKFSYTTPSSSGSYVEVIDKLPLDNSTTTFNITVDGYTYNPSNGEESLVVNINNQILDHDQYSVSGSTITFSNTYPASTECTIIDFVSDYLSNTSNERGSILDRLNVKQNGTRTIFNLSTNGVPEYTKNVGDVFTIKNNQLLRPDSTSQSLTNNKITYVTAPTSSDNIQLLYFNRQLTPANTKNVVINISQCFNDTELTFPLTVSGLLQTPISVNHIFVVRNGVFQKPGTDYSITNSSFITFSDAIDFSETIHVYYSYNGLNQNIILDSLTGINGSQTTHNLTDSGTAFTPPNADDLMVFRNGVIQNPSEDFTVSGSTITFTTAIQTTETTFILYTHSSEELSISSSSAQSSSVMRYTLGTTIASSDYDEVVVYADGTPRFFNKGDFTVSGNKIDLTHTDGVPPTSIFIVKYPTVTLFDELQNCPDGTRTDFRLIYNNANLNNANVTEDADILTIKNGIILNPGNEYSINASASLVTFTTAPLATDNIYCIRMYGNDEVSITNTTGNTYTLGSSYTGSDRESLIVYSNNQVNISDVDFTWVNNNTITLSAAHTTGSLFAIKFNGVVSILDEINTPFNGSRTIFNLFETMENFVPSGTIDNDGVSSDSSILVTKNGKLLESGYDYTLSGDIKSRINFTTAPEQNDIISIRSVGSFDKLDTISSGSGTQFPLQKSSSPYYPNAHIERPRELENQIIVTKNGNIQSPVYDYYIDNNTIVFMSSVTGARLSFIDFRGAPSDVEVVTRLNEISVDDKITISGESGPRTVTSVLSPTVIETASYSDNSPENFGATVSYSGGKVTGLTMTNGGAYYENNVIIRTKGPGTSIQATAKVDMITGENIIDSSTINITNPGSNIYVNQEAVATVFGSIYKELPLHVSSIVKATKLASNINASIETVSLSNTSGVSSNSPSITISAPSHSGANASFNIFVSSGEVRKVEIVSGGSGYDDTETTIELTGGGGTGCVLEPVLSGGVFTGVTVRNTGVGYDTFSVIVDSEVIEYTTVSSNTITGCTRGARNTTAVSHNAQIETGTDDPSTYTLVYFENHDDYL